MSTSKVDDVAGGPGWILSGRDLRPVITDLAEFRHGLGTDPLARAIELLWTADPTGALEILSTFDPTVRVRALRADCHRHLGDTALAVAQYDEIVAEVVGSPAEAVIRQHRGKALLVAGDVERAVADFEHAVALRAGGDSALLASSQQALAFALRGRGQVTS